MTTQINARRRLRVADRVVQRLSRSSLVESEAAALADFVTEGAVCCDIGAQYGLYTLTFAKRVGPTGRVLSFEPLPGPNAFLRAAARCLGARNVVVHPQALGDTQGLGTMSLPKPRWFPVHGRAFLADDADGLGPNAEFAREQRLPVPVTTLDAMVEEANLARLDFVKIDVEGYEPAVLAGAERTIRRFRPAMLIEIEDRHLDKFGADSATVVKMMTEHGYTMWTLAEGAWRPADEVTGHTRNYLFTV